MLSILSGLSSDIHTEERMLERVILKNRLKFKRAVEPYYLVDVLKDSAKLSTNEGVSTAY